MCREVNVDRSQGHRIMLKQNRLMISMYFIYSIEIVIITLLAYNNYDW